uniref:Uncharacterized protein n=1 Tax=Micrurus surinamensis TaxID=129470 RepID=A0A2D4P895_MICSU
MGGKENLQDFSLPPAAPQPLLPPSPRPTIRQTGGFPPRLCDSFMPACSQWTVLSFVKCMCVCPRSFCTLPRGVSFKGQDCSEKAEKSKRFEFGPWEDASFVARGGVLRPRLEKRFPQESFG